MKKLHVGLFFSLNFRAPHDNRKHICAPMTLIEELAGRLHAKGHAVHFLVSGDSGIQPYYYKTPLHKSLYKNPRVSSLPNRSPKRIEISLRYGREAIKEFLDTAGATLDIMHFHDIAYPTRELLASHGVGALFTIHDPITARTQARADNLSKAGAPAHFVCVSKNQATALSVKNKHVVYNGIPLKNYPFNATPKKYLAFSGRMIQKKGAARAIRAARNAGKAIKLAGSIPNQPIKKSYYAKSVAPLLGRDAQYLGIIPYHRISAFYKNAYALLFPIHWKEPFGLVMAEAMACGTPVVAFNQGSVPEIVKHGKTGFIVNNEREMAQAIKKIYDLPEEKYREMRHACREHVEKHFSTQRMVENYEILYHDIVSKHKKK